ncbi:MAG: iron-containing alcohol dehydrogenase, partial [Lawsonibacter sp.]|nr:iron-containing alcohol dehydrogenase [Lawsonibacter sp.]
MKMYDTPHALADYLGKSFTCSCGREHSVVLRYVSIRKDAMEDLPEVIGKLGAKSVYLISDSITYGIAAEKCGAILKAADIQFKIITLKHIAFDEATVGEILINTPSDCDLFIAVGTGAINDMTRFCSYRLGHSFMTIATAAPMDGFASSVAALNVNNLKTTFDAQTPLAIICDTEVLKNAPYRMIAAG